MAGRLHSIHLIFRPIGIHAHIGKLIVRETYVHLFTCERCMGMCVCVSACMHAVPFAHEHLSV